MTYRRQPNPTDLDAAQRFLRLRLAGGEWHSSFRVRQDATLSGLDSAAVLRAAANLCSKRSGAGFDWQWRLRRAPGGSEGDA